MKLTLINLGLAIILTINILFLHSPILGVIFGLSFIMLSSFLIGKIVFKNNDLRERLLFGFLTFLSITIIVLTFIYYFYQLNNWVIAMFVMVLATTLSFLSSRAPIFIRVNSVEGSKKTDSSTLIRMTKRRDYFLVIIYFILLLTAYIFLKSGAAMEAVRTPWIFVPKTFFAVYFVSSLTLIYLSTKLKPACTLILTSLHLFFSFSIANIIFPLGFGYDPFIHQATEKHILDFGFILPKNFYYLGQYSLVIFLTKILQISHVIIDKNLLPLLASILLPTTIYCTYKNLTAKLFTLKQQVNSRLNLAPTEGGESRQNSLFSAEGGSALGKLYSFIPLFLFLLIPFSLFTFTTPQNLADLLVIIIAFLGFKFLSNNYGLLLFLSLATILIHPIAGIAAFIFLILLFLKNRTRRPLSFLISLFLSFSFIFIFFIFSKISLSNKIDFVNNFNLVNFYHNIFRFSPNLFLNTNFVHLLKTVAYFFWQPISIFIIIFILTIYGILKINKNYPLPITHYPLHLKTFLILFINSLLIFSFIKFSFLIDYEQGDFSSRIFNLSIYFLIPIALHPITLLFFRPRCLLDSEAGTCLWQNYFITKNKLSKCAIIMIVAMCLTVSLYFSYPRQDVYYLNRGFNTSIHDFNAVKYLDQITPEPYVVLANQQIGAAALTEFGFRYFDHKYFFYSISTGGELYKIYAKMAYDENINHKIPEEAMDLTGVNIVYLYLPDYWFNLKKIKPQLESVADETLKLENGKVWVFKFVRK